MAVNQVIDVVAMRNCLVPAIHAMRVLRRVPLTLVAGRAIVRVGGPHGDRVFVVVVPVMVVQVAVMQVIDVISMLYGRVPAPWSMDVDVCAIGVNPV